MGLPLVVSDYRSKKILKRLKVTPIHPFTILIVQVSIYAIYALLSFFLIYITAVVFFHYQFSGSWIYFLSSYLLVMLSMFSIGMMVGGISPNTKIASVSASILYFPMLIFSGATLPYEVMPNTLQKIVNFLPLTQGIKLLKAASLGLSVQQAQLPILIMLLLAIICIGISVRFFKWE